MDARPGWRKSHECGTRRRIDALPPPVEAWAMTPLEFLYHFRDLLRERGIRFAITSRMACVYYGLQQNTKDSDWIIEPADLPLSGRRRRCPARWCASSNPRRTMKCSRA